MPATRANDAAVLARELADGFARLRADHGSATQAAMTLTLAHAYLAEYARHLARGAAGDAALAAALEVRLDSGAQRQMMTRLIFAAPVSEL